MSIINTLLFFVALTMSWKYLNAPATIPEETHMTIQADLRSIIESTIAEQAPTATKVQFQRFWTESIDKDSVKAHFKYSFDDNNTENENSPNRVTLDGYAIVNKAMDEDANVERWDFEELHLLNNQVEYTIPLRISNSSDSNE